MTNPILEGIIPPVERELLLKELSQERFVRNTNNGNNDIYIVNHHTAPNTMREIGRLREITFRLAGGGTGKDVDIDHFDTADEPYQQLIVWNPEEKEIVGGYRYIECEKASIDENGEPLLATSRLFNFNEKFIDNFLPYSIELGRSFVQPEYQPKLNSRKGIYSLDNLWDGLGALTIDHPHIKYFFGKITMYPSFNETARDFILYFLTKYFPDKDQLVFPKDPLLIQTDMEELEKRFSGNTYEEDYKTLIQTVRDFNENIPPLINAYMNLSSTMRVFGTALNKHFGLVEETGILVTIGDIYETKKDRHISTYKAED